MTILVPPSAIDAVIDAVLARLRQALPPLAMIDHFPARPAEFDFEGYDAAVLVIYGGSSFSGPVEKLRLEVSVLVRRLAGDGGAYGLIGAVRLALAGASFAGATALRITDVALEAVDDGVAQYRVTAEAALPHSPQAPRGVGVPRQFIPMEDRR